MTTITMKEVAAFLLGEAPLDGAWFGDTRPSEHGQFWWRKHLRAALAAPATAPEQCGHCGRRVIDAPWPVRDTTPEQPSWQDAPTEPGMWACLYMGELSTAIFNAYEIEHFDRDEMVGCRWQFIPEDKP